MIAKTCSFFALPLLLGAANLSAASSFQSLKQHCPTTPIDDRVEVRAHAQGQLSACPPGVDEDCIYSLSAGQTYSAGTPDLNADGLPDQLIKNLGSNYGNYDVVHYLGFVQCGGGTAIKVLEGQFHEIHLPASIKAPWPDLKATRPCPGRAQSEAPLQQIRLVFDSGKFSYVEAVEANQPVPCSW